MYRYVFINCFEILEFAPAAKRAGLTGKGGIVHFEIMPKNINKIVEVNEAVEGDVTTNVRHLLPLLEHRPRRAWFDQLDMWKEKYPFQYSPSAPGAPIKPQAVIEELNRQTAHMKENVIISTGVGCHQMWAAQYFRYNFQSLHRTSLTPLQIYGSSSSIM
jgi:acetolactate synthase I/II/III large subunit